MVFEEFTKERISACVDISGEVSGWEHSLIVRGPSSARNGTTYEFQSHTDCDVELATHEKQSTTNGWYAQRATYEGC